jgi:hypothetical protein
MMNHTRIKLILAVVFITAPLFINNSLAVGMGMGMGMGAPIPCGGPFPPCPIPLDNGILLLLLAGTVYGGKKIYDSMQKHPA